MRRTLACLVLVLFLLSARALADQLLCVNTDNFATIVSRSGETIVPPGLYETLLPLIPDRRFAAALQTVTGLRYALVDAEGHRLTRFTMESVRASGGVVLYRQGDLWGALSEDGGELLPAAYAALDTLDGLRFLATLPDDDAPAPSLYTVTLGQEPVPTGKALLGGMYSFSEERMRYRDGESGLWGYLDGEGLSVIPARFDSALDFAQGVALVSSGGLLGLIKADGSWLVEPRYTWLDRGKTRAVGLLPDGSIEILGLKDARGVWFTKSDFTQCAILGDRVVAYSPRGAFAFGEDGSLNYRGRASERFYEGCSGQLIVTIGDFGQEDVRLLSPDGRVYPGRWNWLIPLSGERYAVLRLDGEAYHSEALDAERVQVDFNAIRYGLMDAEGREVLPCEALSIRALDQNRFLVEYEALYAIVDREGRPVWSQAKA